MRRRRKTANRRVPIPNIARGTAIPKAIFALAGSPEDAKVVACVEAAMLGRVVAVEAEKLVTAAKFQPLTWTPMI